ncbi:MAG: hypothetical protein KKB59_19770 [Spirochaetes bacterium]|nr:hypothetical protein [Spirochaetota bacterium]
MKVYLESKPVPWVTWDIQLWKENQQDKSQIEIVTSVSNADVVMYEWWNDEFVNSLPVNKPIIIYLESLDKASVTPFLSHISNIQTCLVCSDSARVIQVLKENGVAAVKWHRPTRVPKNDHFSCPDDLLIKNNDFVTVCNAERYTDNFAEIVRAYLTVLSKNEALFDHNYDIFSVQPLPFEPFNTIRFNGLQANPYVFRTLKRAKVIISPYNGTGIPISAIDAAIVGTPVLLRDTEANRSVFTWNKMSYFSNEKELAEKFKYYINISPTSADYLTMVQNNFTDVSNYLLPVAMEELIYMCQEIVDD